MRSDYVTKQKNAVLDYFRKNNTEHITALDISVNLKEQGVKIGTATIYRWLDKLVKEGTVKKYITENGACYQYSGEICKNHFHLKCTSCNELFHVDCSFLQNLAPHILNHHKFRVDNTRTVVYGICEKCSGETL